MIQVSRRCYNGSIKYCVIHDLLRDLAIQKAEENGFLEIISIQGGNCSSSSIRRTSLHFKEDGSRLGPNLRSLFYFDSYKLPNLAGLKLLKVLNIVDNTSKGSFGEWDIFKDLAQLRYIGIPGVLYFDKDIDKDSWWKMSSIVKFSKIMSHMSNLQTLIIRYVYSGGVVSIKALNYIWDIKTLRHIIVSDGIHGPPSTAELTNLQTLKLARVRTEWVTKGWPAMPNIRVLKLWDFTDRHLESFRTFLSGLHHLTSLYICTDPLKYHDGMIDMSVLPCYHSLQSLHFDGGCVRRKVIESSLPIHLIKLRLGQSYIKEDPMPILEKLKSLKLLQLHRYAYEGRQLCCSTGGFPRLQCLILQRAKEDKCPQLRNGRQRNGRQRKGPCPCSRRLT